MERTAMSQEERDWLDWLKRARDGQVTQKLDTTGTIEFPPKNSTEVPKAFKTHSCRDRRRRQRPT